MIDAVELSPRVSKQLRRLPLHIVIKLQVWIEGVQRFGIEEVRKISGYHDEPLKGALDGLRSIRLSRSYRAYYRVIDCEVRFLRIERIDKHEY